MGPPGAADRPRAESDAGDAHMRGSKWAGRQWQCSALHDVLLFRSDLDCIRYKGDRLVRRKILAGQNRFEILAHRQCLGGPSGAVVEQNAILKTLIDEVRVVRVGRGRGRRQAPDRSPAVGGIGGPELRGLRVPGVFDCALEKHLQAGNIVRLVWSRRDKRQGWISTGYGQSVQLPVRHQARIGQLHYLDRTVRLDLQGRVLKELHRLTEQRELARDRLAEGGRAAILREESPDRIVGDGETGVWKDARISLGQGS